MLNLAWWVVWRGFAPRIEFGIALVKSEAEFRPCGNLYRFILANTGRRPIIDVALKMRLHISNMGPQYAPVEIIDLPLPRETVPILYPTRVLHPKRKRKLISVYIDGDDRFERTFFPEDIREKAKVGSLSLEDLLSLGEEAFVQVYVFGFDAFSGARRVFVSPKYSKWDMSTEPTKKVPNTPSTFGDSPFG